MSNYKNYMKELKMFRGNMVDVYHDRNITIESLKDHKGSKYYDEKVSILNDTLNKAVMKYKKQTVDSLTKIIAKMRADASEVASVPPTTENVNVLTLLGMSDKITPMEIELYGKDMQNSPLAMKILSQIAQKHNIFVNVLDADASFQKIALLEDAAAKYIDGFQPDAVLLPSVGLLDRCLRPDSEYSDSDWTPEIAERSFLLETVSSADSSFCEGPTGKDPVVELRFKTVDELQGYIDKQTEGLLPVAAEITRDEILSYCAGNAGAVYRNYLATGEKEAIQLDMGE